MVEDSSGNAGCAIAAYAAKAGIRCEILVPANTSPGKLAQILFYGAELNRIPGSREDTAKAALKAADSTYYASHSWNPFFFQGTKTFAYEVWEQMGFRAPDALLLPAGNGTLFIGSFIGFRELMEAGLIGKIPRHIAIQAEKCAPLLKMFRDGLETIPPIDAGETIAEGVAIAAPVRGKEILDIVRQTGGEVVGGRCGGGEGAVPVGPQRSLRGADVRLADRGVLEVPGRPDRHRRRAAYGTRAQGDRKDAEDRPWKVNRAMETRGTGESFVGPYGADIAPPQVKPEPAVQPKQYSPVTTGAPGGGSSRTSETWIFRSEEGRPAARLKSQSYRNPSQETERSVRHISRSTAEGLKPSVSVFRYRS